MTAARFGTATLVRPLAVLATGALVAFAFVPSARQAAATTRSPSSAKRASAASTPGSQDPRVAAQLGHPNTIGYDHYSLKIDGKRVYIWSGEFHYWRLPSPSLWRDVLEKMKAAGYNAVSIYFDWDYHSPAPGVYDFSGIRDADRLLDIATQVGIYVIARPGPYINAETDAGGLAAWLTRMKGPARTDNPAYEKAADAWLTHIDAIIARHQLTEGTGTVIAYQVENEDTDNSPAGRAYMAHLEQKIRSDGITVPFTGNHWGAFASGKGAVDIPGWDSYPQGFNCSDPQRWNGAPSIPRLRQDTPIFSPEFQGGSFDPWGGAGFDKCRQLTGPDFENVFYKNNIADGVTMQSFYMTYGGTSWGWLPEPGVYSSYDYGAAIGEARTLGPKYTEQKRLGYMVDALPSLPKTDQIAAPGPPTNPAISETVRLNPDTGTQFAVLRHADATSTADDTTHISLTLAPKQGFAYDDADTALRYAGDWTHAAHLDYTAGDYQDSESWSGDADASAEVSFTGAGVRWIGPKNTNGGIADVYLDGAKVDTVDTYAPGGKQYQQVLYSATGLSAGEHTLRIVVTGQRNPDSSDDIVVVDAVDTTTAAQLTDIYPRVPQQRGTAIELRGRDAKLLVVDADLGGAARLVYSTSELMTRAAVGGAQTALLYGRAGTDGETVLRYAAKPAVEVLSGDVTTHWDADRGDLRLNYTHRGLARVRVSAGGQTLRLLIADYPVSGEFWRQHTSAGTVLVRGPYLVRDAAVSGGTLALRGDTDARTDLEVWAPASVGHLTWDGEPVATTRTAYGTLVGRLGGPPKVSLPALGDWRFRYGSPERLPGFDDAGWTLADHRTTNNPHEPGSLPVLYEDDYGFHHGDVWYRGHFTATGGETGITLDGEGGNHGVYSVWLNGVFLGTQGSGTHTFAFPSGALRAGRDNVVAVLVMNMGHDECGAPCTSFANPRGIRTAVLRGASPTLTWRIQGAKGGEHPADAVRGPMNTGGLYGERHGWSLPGYPDRSWKQVSLPDRWAARGLPAGVGWYRTTFTLDLPVGTDVPVGLRIADDPTHRYRAQIFLNGWNMGLYANALGPQHTFSLPTGILRPDGRNTLAIAVWGEDDAGGGLGQVSLVSYGAYAGGVPVTGVDSPRWNAHTWGPPVAPPNITLGLSSDETLLSGGQTTAATGTVTNPGGSAATHLRVRLRAPSGWTVRATSPTSFAAVEPGGKATATWQVTAPSDLASGTYTLPATVTYRQRGRQRSSGGALTFTVPYASLADAFSNIGISDDSNPSAADFDGAGYSFSAQALAAEGLTPGAAVTHAGLSLTWPDVPAGEADNVPASGQVITVPGQGDTLGFLGASNSGSPTGTGTVYYADGSTAGFSLTFGDFWYPPCCGNDAVASTPYLNHAGTGRYDHTVYIFYAGVPVNPAKKVVAVALPAISSGPQGHVTAMHIFAVGVG